MSEELKLLTDLYIEAWLDLEDAVLGKEPPDPERKEVIHVYRIAAVIANHVSGLPQEGFTC